MTKAAQKRDWLTAAKQCNRKAPVSEDRNRWAAGQFQKAAAEEKTLQQHKKPTGKVMPSHALTQPHAWYDPVFDILEEMYQKLKSELLPPRTQGRR